MNRSDGQEPKTFTDFLRRMFKGVLDHFAGFLNRLGLKPNVITAVGLVGHLIAAVLIAFGELLLGGLITLIIVPLDAVDGTMARLRNESGPYGALIDSVTDRYSEIALYAGLFVYFHVNGTWGAEFLVFFAAVGSIMVSYMRARAEALGFSAKVGLLTRAERYMVLLPGIIFGFPTVSLWILAVMTHVTAIHRFWFVRNQAKNSILE